MSAPILDAPDSTKQILLDTLYDWDASRARSRQTLPGASELGGCRRRTWFKMTDTPEVNLDRKFAAIRGTAMHEVIEAAFRLRDPEGKRFLPEVAVAGYPGMGEAHVDLVDLERKIASDWKTTLKRNLRYFPKDSQRWQVQVYGDRLAAAGYDIEWVELVAIPLDGKEEEIRVHREPRDPAIAAQAYAWLEDLVAKREAGEIPPADLSGAICESYCPYFGPETCSGK